MSSLSKLKRIALLAAQALSLGLVAAWVTIPASAIFVQRYGSNRLPWTYIGAAILGVAASVALSAALRRLPLVVVTIRVLTCLAAALTAGYVGLALGAEWVAIPLIVVFPVLIPVGFMFVVGQAGEMLDVRVLKSSYGRVVAGFALGFVAGGLAAPALLSLLGTTESLVGCAALASALFVGVVAVTSHLVPELHAHAGADDDTAAPSIGELLRDRYVVLLAAFQMLSAVESQWLDFLVVDRASRRYESSEALAAFIGRFTAISYGADLIVLLLIAGWVLRKFGLRIGLTVHAAGVLGALVATTVATALTGSASTLVFVLLVGARVSDIALGDGASRTSLGAAYQAVPKRQRLAAQASIEGLAVPLAIGFSGVALLVVEQVANIGGRTLVVLTAVTVAIWLAIAIALYRGYRVTLLANLRHRVLDPAELTIDHPSTLAAIDRLISSDDERDVRLGAHALKQAGHELLVSHLMKLATDDRVGVRTLVLQNLAPTEPQLAAEIARSGLTHLDPAIRAVSLGSLGDLGDASDVPLVEPLWDDIDEDVRVAAAGALAHLGSTDAHDRVTNDLGRLAVSSSPDDRIVAARVLGVCAGVPSIHRDSLDRLLGDECVDVRRHALDSVAWPDDASRLSQVMACIDERELSGPTVDALLRVGADTVERLAQGLEANSGWSRFAQEQAARVCRMVGGEEALATLVRHVDHPNRDVGLVVRQQLAILVWERGDPTTLELVSREISPALATDLRFASNVLAAMVTLGGSNQVRAVLTGLDDELMLAQRRALALLTIRYGPDGVGSVAFQLAQPDVRLQALALEWLDVTLVGTDRAAIALLEPGLSAARRLQALNREPRTGSQGTRDVLYDLVHDAGNDWRRPWLAACALAAAFDRGDGFAMSYVDGREPLRDEATASSSSPWYAAPIVAETLEGLRVRLDRPTRDFSAASTQRE
ncbi:MAG TPA: hypothetical protein VMM60_15820 [Ilumatobacter sp.]|nr:hypothetical protein [Ilumatobacter sp.]